MNRTRIFLLLAIAALAVGLGYLELLLAVPVVFGMAAEQRRAGIISVQINGEVQDAAGDFEYNLGALKRETMIGVDKVHGFKETPQAPFIKGTIRDRKTLDLKALASMEDVTVTLQLANGKVVVLRNAWFDGDGTAKVDDASIEVSFSGMSAEES